MENARLLPTLRSIVPYEDPLNHHPIVEQPHCLSPLRRTEQGLDRAMDRFPREDDAAKWRRNNVIVRVNRVPRDTRFLPHLRVGGAQGYNIPFHQMLVVSYRAGNMDPEGMLRISNVG